jgi:2-oxoglutarate ferredoxin oxidoreductase subunit beta
VEDPVSPVQFALGAGARFIARAIDTQQKHLIAVLKAAQAHRGASFVEIFQNCIVYNDEVFAEFTGRNAADQQQVLVEHGKPMVFAGGRKGLRLNPRDLSLEVVEIGEDGAGGEEVLVHDATNRTLAGLLAAMQPPAMPVALGVLYADPQPSFGERRGEGPRPVASAEALNRVLRRGDTWTVAASASDTAPPGEA